MTQQPTTRQYAEAIGADGYSDNASAAVTLARSLMEGKRQAAANR
jgi:methanogenic corrinoid protein MtbC1